MDTIQTEPNVYLQFVPLLFLTCISTVPFIVVSILIAPRKGFSTLIACILSIIPIVNLPFVIWLASKTDEKVLARLNIEKE